MHQRSVCFAFALLAAAVAANANAACEVAASITGVTGDPSGAVLYRNSRPLPVEVGSRVCAGDRLSAGTRTLVKYETKDGFPAQVSGRTILFPPHEGHANEADID